MADDYCKELLVAWDLGGLVERFQENGINESIISALTPDLIKELIPQIGLRIKFALKWGEQFSKKKKDEELPQNPIENSESSQMVSEGSSDNQENLDSNNINGDSAKTIVTKLCRPHVKDMLKRCMQGRAILKSYLKTKTLSRQCRNMIVGIIISEILQDFNGSGSLKNEGFDLISKEIVQTFPTEVSGTYYVPPITKKFSRDQRSITSRGKLIDKYRNKIREYRKLTGRNIGDETPSTSSSVDQSSGDEMVAVDIETQRSVQWLEKNQAPWELVISHWTATYQHRRNEIKKDWNSVAHIFKEWPILQHPMGHELVNLDFELLELTKIVNTAVNWEKFVDTIHELSDFKKTKKTNDLYELLKSEDLNKDSKVAVQLLLLPHFVPPKGRIRTKAKHWKPTITECAESLIEHAKIPGDISRIQSRKVEVMSEMKLTVQPYIIVVGPTLKEISTFYVCIDKTLYSVESTLSAINICFKAYHVFNATYPAQSEHIWYLIQHGLYQITTKYDKQISYIMELIKFLQNQSSIATAE